MIPEARYDLKFSCRPTRALDVWPRSTRGGTTNVAQAQRVKRPPQDLPEKVGDFQGLC